MPEFTAFIIEEEEWELMVALDPDFNQLSFEENKGRYLVLNFQKKNEDRIPWMIVHPKTFSTMFREIKNDKHINRYKFVE